MSYPQMLLSVRGRQEPCWFPTDGFLIPAALFHAILLAATMLMTCSDGEGDGHGELPSLHISCPYAELVCVE